MLFVTVRPVVAIVLILLQTTQSLVINRVTRTINTVVSSYSNDYRNSHRRLGRFNTDSALTTTFSRKNIALLLSDDDEDNDSNNISNSNSFEKNSELLPGFVNSGIDENILSIQLNDELKNSFMSYAMSTILSRALPDARDGLKPVHRRVLYAMNVLNLLPDSSYRKCARIVGEVLGKFHPHGDQSVYDALVRMAQDFIMLHPLILGHGNFGSNDNDPPAAMRYTESKLSSLAYDALLADIKEGTTDFIPNFDGNEQEPVVLPARLPMLLLNGASGIAVGMATNIPPHNLGELCDAITALVDRKDLSDEVNVLTVRIATVVNASAY